jgi:hypothetical protein
MRKSTISLLFGVLLAGAAVAAEPAPANLQDYPGQYVLADGRILTVGEVDGKLTASIAARPLTMSRARHTTGREVVLKADGLGSFKSTSTPLQISFHQDARGDIAQVRLNEDAAPMVALARR